MLTEDELQEIEGDVGACLRLAQVDDDEPPQLELVAVAVTGGAPQLTGRRRSGHWTGRRIELPFALAGTRRGRHVLGHEIGHAYAERFLRREPTEAWCDAFGAMLAAPRRAVRGAVALAGHRVHELAELLEVEQAGALLRLGEVTGRPVALVRLPGLVVARGEPFPWPPLREVLRARPAGIHPVRVEARWGMMRAA